MVASYAINNDRAAIVLYVTGECGCDRSIAHGIQNDVNEFCILNGDTTSIGATVQTTTENGRIPDASRPIGHFVQSRCEYRLTVGNPHNNATNNRSFNYSTHARLPSRFIVRDQVECVHITYGAHECVRA